SPPSEISKIKNYIIEKKSPGDNDYVVIDNISPRFLTYSDAGLLGNTKYQYRVSVTKSDGILSSSNEAVVITVPFVNIDKSNTGENDAPLTNSINFFSTQNGTQTLEFSKKLKAYNVIPTRIIQTGVERQLQINVSDDNGIAAIKHVGVLMNFDDDDVLRKSDTYFVYDEGVGLTVSDPLEIFGDVQVYRTYTKTEMILTFTFTPQKPISITELVINSWDDKLSSQSVLIPNAVEIQGEPMGQIISALSEPVPENIAKPKYELDKDGNMISYDAFGNLDGKVLRAVKAPFVYHDNIGKSYRFEDGFGEKITEERIKAQMIADKMIRFSATFEPEKKDMTKTDKAFTYPKSVGKTDRRDVQTIKTMMEKENDKAQNYK
ncbi:MAG: hypothetical protein ACRD94_06540, partial [Nitrosopumilaceae archaeon]